MSIRLSSRSVCVFRGGSWDYDPQLARVAFRSNSDPGRSSDYLGLRLVRRAS